jgi:hypothetical protein
LVITVLLGPRTVPLRTTHGASVLPCIN